INSGSRALSQPVGWLLTTSCSRIRRISARVMSGFFFHSARLSIVPILRLLGPRLESVVDLPFEQPHERRIRGEPLHLLGDAPFTSRVLAHDRLGVRRISDNGRRQIGRSTLPASLTSSSKSLLTATASRSEK